ncbi:MAG: ATP-binding protein [Cyanobacteria bacterium P01_D01_bin.14]
MLGKHFFRYYRQASLPLKISLPFILLFVGCWTAGTFALGEYFTNRLESKQAVRAEELAALVEREIEKELDYLRTGARLLSIKTSIAQSTSAADVVRLRQLVLPLKGILDTDLISVVDATGETILDARQPTMKNRQIEAERVKNLLINGADLATVVGSSNQGPPILLGTAPIKTDQGIEGGIFVGIVLGNDRLAQINEIINEQLVIVSDKDRNGEGEIIASTFDEIPSELSWLDDLIDDDETLETVRDKDYLVQDIHLDSLEGEHFYLILLISKASLHQAKRTTWLVIVAIAALGTVLMTLLATVIARIVAQPIQKITKLAQQVVQEENFELRTAPNSKDELGALAQALNQLIQWVGEYTDKLEDSARTLESRVETRTQELSDTITQLKETQSQLIQTEKMSSLGQMVAGIAHEINNPINFIQGNLAPLQDYFQDLLGLIETYQSEYPQGSKVISEKQAEIDLEFLLEDTEKTLKSINLGTERVRDIVVSLRNYSRLDESTVKNADLHDGINSTLLILNHRIKQGVEVIKDYGALPMVRCAPSQLNQVFTNIIANALDAMFDADSEPKRLTIATRALSEDQVQVSFRDTGPGMTPEIKAKIFDPFFTTKPIGKGTGLGMGICFKIIEQHQGSIELNTAVGQGTEFVITLPVDSAPGGAEMVATLVHA